MRNARPIRAAKTRVIWNLDLMSILDPIAAFERVALRPDLHAPPEIGFEEQRTASIVG